MRFDGPRFVNDRYEFIDQFRNVIEVRRDIVSDVYRLSSKPPAELRYVRYGCGVQRPQHVLVERLDPLRENDLNAVGQGVVLPEEVLLLDSSEKDWVVSFPDRHRLSAYLIRRIFSDDRRTESFVIKADCGALP